MAKEQVVKSILNLDGNAVKNIANPVEPKDAVNLEFLQKTLNENSFRNSVLNIQKDISLIPIKTTSPISSYIITNKDTMHSDFGAIPGIGNNDIVEFDGVNFVISFDASTVIKEYTIVFNEAEEVFYQYSKSEDKWEPMYGLNDMELGDGLEVIDQKLRIKDNVAEKFEAVIGDGVATDFNIMHNLNNSAVDVSFKDLLTNQKISGYVEYISINEILVSLNPAPATNQIKVIVLG